MVHRHGWLIGIGVVIGLAAALAWFAAGGRPSLATDGILYVDADATSGANDGSSWADAYTTLQPALGAAVAGNEIWVAAGTYKPTDGTDRAISFQLVNGVAIYGGFDPTVGDDAWEERDWVNNVTVLSGDLNGDDGPDFANNGENSYHVFYHPAGTALDGTAILDGFAVTGGNASGASTHFYGGGMYNSGSSPTLAHCAFEDNSAGLGGGMHNTESSAPTLTGCTFAGNSADYGGGMSNYYSAPELTGCAFVTNSAGYGGGIYNTYYSVPTLAGCTFTANPVDYDGAGMYNDYYSTPTLTGCTFEGNSANRYGGGMHNNAHSSPTLTDCTFSGNTAGTEGGGMNNAYSSPILTGCTFSGNRADAGGGIYNGGSSPVLTNCNVVGNSADSGGGMHNDGSSPTLVNCTFRGNSAAGNGGGMRNTNNSSPTLTNCTFGGNTAKHGGAIQTWNSSPVLTNCILWGDTPHEMYNYDSSSTPSVDYSDIEGGCATVLYNICGDNNIDADPRFVDAANGDLHLLPGSPCIDAGTDSAPFLPSHDFEGDPRVLDGNGDGEPIVDMGVDEALWYPVYLPLVLRGY